MPVSRKILLFICLWLFIPLIASAQVSIRDSAISTTMVYAAYSYQFPGGDLAVQFGSNSSIGGGFLYKTKRNWLFGVEGNFMFGQSVKNSDSLLTGISTRDGFVIDANGMYAEIVFYERGYNLQARFGKVIPLLAPNPNSGFVVMAGIGYLQNKIRIHVINNTAPQLEGDYKKGYDRLNGGLVLSGSLGYMYLGNTRLLNFYLGFEFTQAWTKPYRDFDFNTGRPDTRKFSSQFYGIKACWFIPLFRRAPKQFYYY
jgi:hypothetical protein